MLRLFPAVALVVVLLSVPVASACSFVGDGPPSPGRIWVWDMEEDRYLAEVDVWTRGLGSLCELVQTNALDAHRFAYVDRAGDSRGVWLLDLDQGGPPEMVFRLNGAYQALDLHGDMLSIHMSTTQYTRDTGGKLESRVSYHVFTVDLQSGAAQRADLPTDWRSGVAIQEGILSWRYYDWRAYDHRFSAYDLMEGGWIYDNVSVEETFGFDEGAFVHTMNRGWVLIESAEGAFAHQRETGQLVPVPGGFGYRFGLDADRFYRFDFGADFERIRLSDGTVEQIALPERGLFEGSVFNGSKATLGAYSLKDEEVESRTPPRWVTHAEGPQEYPLPEHLRHQRPPLDGFPVPGAALLPLVVLVLFAVVYGRKGRGDGAGSPSTGPSRSF